MMTFSCNFCIFALVENFEQGVFKQEKEKQYLKSHNNYEDTKMQKAKKTHRFERKIERKFMKISQIRCNNF